MKPMKRPAIEECRDIAVRSRRIVIAADRITTERTVQCARSDVELPISDCRLCPDHCGVRVQGRSIVVRCRGDRSAPPPPTTETAEVRERSPRLASVMTADVVCVRPDLEVAALRVLLANQPFSGTPVVDEEGRPVGVISQTDLARAELMGVGAKVSDVMTPMPLSLAENAPLSVAVAHMATEDLHRIAVVDTSGRVVGIISTLDVVRWLAAREEN